MNERRATTAGRSPASFALWSLLGFLLLPALAGLAVPAPQPRDVRDRDAERKELQEQARAEGDASAATLRAYLESTRKWTGLSDESITAMVEKRRKAVAEEFASRWTGDRWMPASYDGVKWTGWEGQRDEAEKHAKQLVIEAGRAAGHENVLKSGLVDRVEFDPDPPRGRLGRFRTVVENGKVVRVVTVTAWALTDHLYTGQLQVAGHELVHAEQFDRILKKHLETEKDRAKAELAAHEEFQKTVNTDRLKAELEVEAQTVSWERTRAHVKRTTTAIDRWVGKGLEAYRAMLARAIAAEGGSDDSVGDFAKKNGLFLEDFTRSVGGTGTDLPRDKARDARFSWTLAHKPIFGGIVLGNRTHEKSVRLRKARVKVENGQAYLDLEVDGPAGPQSCRYDVNPTELWVAYHVVRPTEEMRTKYRLDGKDSNLIGCDVDALGLEGRFALHPALANTWVAWFGKRLDALVAAGAPGLFDGVDLARSPMQWYDEAALLRVVDGRLVVEAADGPRDVLLRARFWGSEKTPDWLARMKPVRLAADGGGPASWLEVNGRDEKVALELQRRLFERLAYGKAAAERPSPSVTKEQYLAAAERASAELLDELGGNRSVDSGAVIAAAYDLDPSIPLMDHFAKTLAVLNWVADAADVPFPELPAEVKPVTFPVSARLPLVDLMKQLREQVPDPVVADPDAEEDGKYEFDRWYAYFAGDLKLGYRRDTLRKATEDGKAVVISQRLDKRQAFADGQTVTFRRKLTAVSPYSLFRGVGGSWGFGLNRFEYEVALSTLPPAVLAGRFDEKAGKFAVTADGKTDHISVVSAFDEVVRSLQQKPMKPGESRTVVGHHPERGLKGCIQKLEAANDLEATEVLGVEQKLLRIECSVSALPLGDKWTETLWTDPKGVVVKQVVPGKVTATYYLTSADDALRRRKYEPMPFPRSVSLFKADRPLKQPELTGKLVLRVRLKDALADTPFAETANQKVRRVDDRTFELEITPSAGGTAGDAPPEEFRKPNPLLQSDDPAIVALASMCLPGAEDQRRLAADLEWTVFRTLTKSYNVSHLTAAQALRLKEGACGEHAALLAALARARGVPSRVATGLKYVPELEAFVGHAWAELYVDGAWRPFDATVGRGGIGATYVKTDDSPGRFPDAEDAPNLARLSRAGVVAVEVVEQEPVKPAEQTLYDRKVDLADRPLGLAPKARAADRLAAFKLGRSLPVLAEKHDMLGPDHPSVKAAAATAREAAAALGAEVPDLGASQGLTELASLNALHWTVHRAEARLAPHLRQSYGEDVEAALLFATRAQALTVLYFYLREDEREARCREIEKLARSAGLPEKAWKPFLDAADLRAALAELVREFGPAMDRAQAALEEAAK